MRSLQDIRDAYARFSRRIKLLKKSGLGYESEKHARRELHGLLRVQNTHLRHLQWLDAYVDARDVELDKAFMDGLTEKQAAKRAHIRAERSVAAEFLGDVKKSKTVRVALTVLLSD